MELLLPLCPKGQEEGEAAGNLKDGESWGAGPRGEGCVTLLESTASGTKGHMGADWEHLSQPGIQRCHPVATQVVLVMAYQELSKCCKSEVFLPESVFSFLSSFLPASPHSENQLHVSEQTSYMEHRQPDMTSESRS